MLPKLLFLLVLASASADGDETCGDEQVLVQARRQAGIAKRVTSKVAAAVEVGKVEVAQNQEALLTLGHSVGAVRTSADGSRQMRVAFNHEGREHQYELAPHSVYAKKSQVYRDGVLLGKGANPQPRNFKARGHGRRASMTLLGNNKVRGLFEHDGRVLEVTPIAHLHHPLAALVQTSESDDQAQPAHLIRWVAASELGTLGRKKLGLSLSVTKQTKVGNETHGFYGDTSGIADFGGDGSDIPVGTDNGTSFQTDQSGHPLAEFWHGVKWWPGCYRDDHEMQEFVLTIVTDKAAWDKVPQHWDFRLDEAAHTDHISDEQRSAALQRNVENIVIQASFVYEMQLNIHLKIGYLGMDTTGSEYGECAADGEEMYDRLYKMKDLIEQGKVRPGAASHFLTGCGPIMDTLAGLAYRGKICEDEWAVGSDKIYSIGHAWLILAHELGHNFGAGHSFEHGQGSTGGIMDYGDGMLDGEYQFSNYRRQEICSKIDSVVNQCEGNFQKHPNPGSLFPDIPGMIGPDEDPFAEGGSWDMDFPIFTPPPIEIPPIPEPLPECQGDRFTWASGRGGCWEYQKGFNEFHDFWCTQDRQTDTPPGGIPENNGFYAGDVCSECGRCKNKLYTEPYLCSWRNNMWCRCHGEMYLGKKYVSGSSGSMNTFEQMKQGTHVSTPLNLSMAQEKQPLEEWTLPTGAAWIGSFSATKLKCKSGDCPYTAGTFVPKFSDDPSPEACWCDPSVPSTVLGPLAEDETTQAPSPADPNDQPPPPYPNDPHDPPSWR